jgi:hypothetical protein
MDYGAGMKRGIGAVFNRDDGSVAHFGHNDNYFFSHGVTTCAWINIPSQDKNDAQIVAASGSVMTGEKSGWGMYVKKDSSYNKHHGVNARVSVRMRLEKGNYDMHAPLPDDGRWHSACFTYGDDYAAMYVDGKVFEQKLKRMGDLVDSTNGISLGGMVDDDKNKYGFTGAINSVRIWNRRLSSDEFSELFSCDSGIGASKDFYGPDDTTVDPNPIDFIVMDPVDGGCSDGTVEGFHKHENIAACQGAWGVKGVASKNSHKRQCDGRAGNTGDKSHGCSVTDICAVGWHVCINEDEVAKKSHDKDACNTVGDLPENVFFITRQSGPGWGIPSDKGTNDVFGCTNPMSLWGGHLREGTLNAYSRNLGGNWDGVGKGDEADKITSNDNDISGVLCCRDDRVHNVVEPKGEIVVIKIAHGEHDAEEAKDMAVKMREDVERERPEMEQEIEIVATRKWSKSSDQSKSKSSKSAKSAKSKSSKGGSRGGSSKSEKSHKSHSSKSSKSSKGGRGRKLLQEEDTTYYTYITYDISGSDTVSNQDVLDAVNAILSDSNSEFNAEFSITSFETLHECEDGSVRESCAGVELRSNDDSTLTGYPDEQTTGFLSSSSEVMIAVISTSAVFALLIVLGFVFKSKQTDVKNLNSSTVAHIELGQIDHDEDIDTNDSEESEQYWVFNKQRDVRVVV